VLPGGLVSLPRLWRRRKNEHRGMPAGGAGSAQAATATIAPTAPAYVVPDTSAPEPIPPTQSQEKRQDT